MPGDNKRSWRIVLPMLLVITIITLWSVYWFIAIGVAEQTFAAERQRLAQQGWTLGCTEESWAGYPFRFEYNCSSPVAKYASRFEIRSGNLLAIALAYNPWQVAVLVDGPSKITGLTPEPIDADHQRGLLVVTLGDKSTMNVSADLPTLTLRELLSVESVRIDTRPADNGRIEFAASMKKFDYHPDSRSSLPIDEGMTRGFLTPERKALIDNIEISQSKIRLWGHGKFTLDDARRPAGRLSTETNDLNGLLALLDPHIDLTEEQKSGLRTILGLLGNEAKADIIAKDGSLFVGPFRAADLRPLF